MNIEKYVYIIGLLCLHHIIYYYSFIKNSCNKYYIKKLPQSIVAQRSYVAVFFHLLSKWTDVTLSNNN